MSGRARAARMIDGRPDWAAGRGGGGRMISNSFISVVSPYEFLKGDVFMKCVGCSGILREIQKECNSYNKHLDKATSGCNGVTGGVI